MERTSLKTQIKTQHWLDPCIRNLNKRSGSIQTLKQNFFINGNVLFFPPEWWGILELKKIRHLNLSTKGRNSGAQNRTGEGSAKRTTCCVTFCVKGWNQDTKCVRVAVTDLQEYIHPANQLGSGRRHCFSKFTLLCFSDFEMSGSDLNKQTRETVKIYYNIWTEWY